MAEEKADLSSKPFLEHLEDLRKTFLGVAVSLLVGMLVAWPLAPDIKDLLVSPVDGALANAGIEKSSEDFLQVIELTSPFVIAFSVIFWSGLIMSAPFMIYFLAQFIFPGLTKKEKTAIKRSGIFVVLLFAAGVFLGFNVTLGKAIEIMINISVWMGVPLQMVLLNSYITFALKLLLAFGLSFQLPIVIMILGHLGLVDSRMLRDKRKHFVVGALIIGMLLTPPEVFTQVMLAVPMYLLYEASIWIIWLKERASREAEIQEKDHDKND